MCNPMAFAVATMVITAAGTAVSQYQASEAREEQQKAAKEEARLAREAEENQLAALDAQLEQETDKAEVQKLDRQRQALRERAKIRVQASESGAFGNATLKELSASFIGEGADKGLIDYNLRTTEGQIHRQKAATKTNTKARVNRASASVPTAVPGWMSGLNIGLSGASGAIQGYETGKNL